MDKTKDVRPSGNKQVNYPLRKEVHVTYSPAKAQLKEVAPEFTSHTVCTALLSTYSYMVTGRRQKEGVCLCGLLCMAADCIVRVVYECPLQAFLWHLNERI